MLRWSMSPTWILVADGSHARLFHSAEMAQPWRLVRKLDREHGHEKSGPEGSHEDRGEHGFARLLVSELETRRQAGGFDRLVLVAPPKFLGQLRGELQPSLATCVVRSQDADYTGMSDTELSERVDIS